MSLINSINYQENILLLNYQGTNGLYYKLKNIVSNWISCPIDSHFPIDWLLKEKMTYNNNGFSFTGPFECKICQKDGFCNGVFIGYCCNCAKVHNYKRGFGIIQVNNEPKEANTYIFDHRMENFPLKDSIWKKYLLNIKIDDIGDINLKNLYQNGYFDENIKDNYNDDYESDDDNFHINN